MRSDLLQEPEYKTVGAKVIKESTLKLFKALKNPDNMLYHFFNRVDIVAMIELHTVHRVRRKIEIILFVGRIKYCIYSYE